MRTTIVSGGALYIFWDVVVGMDWERHLNWLEPWEPVRSSMGETYLLTWETQLTREVGPEHPLYRANAKLIARRFDCDDALYALDDGLVAMVHLTWRSSQEPAPRWPETTIFGSIEAWERDGLAADHADWLLDQS